MSQVSARWVPRMKTKDQKKSRLDISKYLLSLYEDDPEEFMRRVVTQDETWVHQFDPEAKKVEYIMETPRLTPPKKSKRVSLAQKVMASIFWDNQGPVVQS